MAILKHLSSLTLTALVFSATAAWAAPSYTVTARIVDAESADSVLLLSKNRAYRKAIAGSRFTFTRLTPAILRNARLYFFKDGAQVGPGVLKQTGTARFMTLSGNAPAGRRTLSLRFSAEDGYLRNRAVIAARWIGSSRVTNANFAGASLGFLGVSGSSSLTSSNVGIAATGDINEDGDRDGVPDVLDIDTDNDGITNDRDSSGGSMVSSLYLTLQNTINAHRGNLNDTTIEETISSSNQFGLTFFIGLNGALAAGTGGHVVCDASQVICRSTADGGTTSFYTGVSESDPSFRDRQWSSINDDGSGRPNLEVISLGSDRVLVAAIQPRSSSFSAGELITANVTNGSTIIGTRIFTVLPPFISSPMLFSYDLGSGAQTVDYDDSFAPGSSQGNSITMTGNSMTLNFYPPQRRAIVGAEPDGAFRDIGSSRLGVVIGGTGITSEFTCAGYYSNLSSGLTEGDASVTLPGGSYLANQGAQLWPISDSTPDTITTDGTVKTLTIDLANCLNRAGYSPGTYQVTIMYAGTDTSFGAPRSGQMVYVTIPAPI